MTYRNIGLKNDTFQLIEKCRDEYLKHHPEMKKMTLSNNKVLFEAMSYYLNH